MASTFGSTSSEDVCYLQPDNVDDGDFDDMDNNDETICARTCVEGEPPRCCYYKFFLESYVTMARACGNCSTVPSDCYRHQCVTADGYARAILTVNRKMPGPSIQVCKDDTILIDVSNHMKGRGTSIHWHGIHQRGTPTMDGVPMVTQCPITDGQKFRYNFQADKAGTYFWHSHDGPQKLDGIVGSLVVRQPISYEPHQDLYDKDIPSHVIVVQDWQDQPADEILPEFSQGNVMQIPTSYLISGRGFKNLSSQAQLSEVENKMPLAQFRVEKGKRYRFRIIGSTCLSCPYSISFQSHKLLLIAADIDPIQPVTVDSIGVNSGERYDIVLDANQPVGTYWIRVQGMGACSGVSQVAVLFYEDSPTSEPTTEWTNDLGYTLNPTNSSCSDDSLTTGICMSQLHSEFSTPDYILKSRPDTVIPAFIGFHDYTDQDFDDRPDNEFSYNFVPVRTLLSTVNNFTNKMTPSPLLTQFSDVPQSSFCNLTCQSEEYCECTHLRKLALNSLVDIYIVDSSGGGLQHPFHLHGFSFYVLDQGVFTKPVANISKEELDEWMNQEWELSNTLPIKDTVSVPPSGYAIVRFYADNPGFWLFHCHFNIHNELGMQIVFQVGELSDMPETPNNFPKCREFVPVSPFPLRLNYSKSNDVQANKANEHDSDEPAQSNQQTDELSQSKQKTEELSQSKPETDEPTQSTPKTNDLLTKGLLLLSKVRKALNIPS